MMIPGAVPSGTSGTLPARLDITQLSQSVVSCATVTKGSSKVCSTHTRLPEIFAILSVRKARS